MGAGVIATTVLLAVAVVVGAFVFGLRGERLYEAGLTDSCVSSFTAHFSGEFGRIRAVTVGLERESLYITTSNTTAAGRRARATTN